MIRILAGLMMVFACACSGEKASAPTSNVERFDAVIRGGVIYDGSGSAPYRGGVAIRGDRIAKVGDLGESAGDIEIDAAGQAIAPGFINMLSWAVEDLIEDGRSLADIHQGVTLEVFGEGVSYGPWTEEIKAERKAAQQDIKYENRLDDAWRIP